MPLIFGHYLATEVTHDAIYGPYKTVPIDGLHTSPMLSRPKPSSDHRRIIVDLSWPHGAAVNSELSSTLYLNSQCKLTYPSIQVMVDAVVQANAQGVCYMFKVDLERAFRNLRVDPLDYKVLGLYWDNSYYLDTGVPFGLIFGSFWCQKTTDAIRHIMQAHGFTIFNYSDDLISINKSLEEAQDVSVGSPR